MKTLNQLIQEARQNEDWDLHERLWEERRVAEVEADEEELAAGYEEWLDEQADRFEWDQMMEAA